MFLGTIIMLFLIGCGCLILGILSVIFCKKDRAYRRRNEIYQEIMTRCREWMPTSNYEFQPIYDNNPILFLAIISRNMDLMDYILARSDLLQFTSNSEGRSALHLAVETQNLEIIRKIITYSDGIMVVDQNGCTPLHLTGKLKNEEVIKELVQISAFRRYQTLTDGCYTFLHYYILERYGYGDWDRWVWPSNLNGHRIFIESIKNYLDPALFQVVDRNGCNLEIVNPFQNISAKKEKAGYLPPQIYPYQPKISSQPLVGKNI